MPAFNPDKHLRCFAEAPSISSASGASPQGESEESRDQLARVPVCHPWRCLTSGDSSFLIRPICCAREGPKLISL